MPEISVIIATRDRDKHLKTCLHSLLGNSYKDFEIIIIDQSLGSKSTNLVDKINSDQIIYKKQNAVGKSKALNLAISIAKGKILAFTDDDCIVEKNWLSKIRQSFAKHKNISFIFGKIHAYKVISSKSYYVILPQYELLPAEGSTHIWQTPDYSLTVVSGNNMAIRKSLLDEKIGYFKTWLGPGSVGFGGEDTEMAYRALVNNQKVLYDPSIVIYHNSLLTKDIVENKGFRYFCSFITVFTYYSSKGIKIFHDLLKETILQNLTVWEKIILQTIKGLHFSRLIAIFVIIIKQTIFIVWSILLAFYCRFIETFRPESDKNLSSNHKAHT